MNLTSTTDEVMMFCIVASMAIIDAFSTLLSILKKGIFVDQKSLLMQKTNKELWAMLVGVERIFPVHAPIIDSIEVVRKGKVRRSKLYYLRDRVGKSAKIKEDRN